MSAGYSDIKEHRKFLGVMLAVQIFGLVWFWTSVFLPYVVPVFQYDKDLVFSFLGAAFCIYIATLSCGCMTYEISGTSSFGFRKPLQVYAVFLIFQPIMSFVGAMIKSDWLFAVPILLLPVSGTIPLILICLTLGRLVKIQSQQTLLDS